MKKTLTALAAIAALGTGIIAAQAETGYNANESVAFKTQMKTTASAASSDNLLTNDGHNY
jgi:hypothetical protein